MSLSLFVASFGCKMSILVMSLILVIIPILLIAKAVDQCIVKLVIATTLNVVLKKDQSGKETKGFSSAGGSRRMSR